MSLRAVALSLMVLGAVVTASALLLAALTTQDMDPPYESATPYLMVALAGFGVFVAGRAVSWFTVYGGSPREPDPFDFD